MRRILMAGLGLGTVLGLAGCANPEESILAPGGRVNSAAAGQIVGAETEPFDARRLAVIIEVAASGKETAPALTDSVARLDQAMTNFAREPYENGRLASATTQNRLRDVRNSIQDQLIAASTNRCNVYKTHLRRLSSNVQFGFGSAATLAGAAGALVTGGASQALAAAAGGLSGVNAEFQKDFMGSLVSSIIIPGIDRQRADLRNNIVSNSCLGISDYPLPLAISEVIRFHGACSADVGIAASGQAVSRTTPDSISAALAAIEQVRKINTVLQTPTDKDIAAAKKRAEMLEARAKKLEDDAKTATGDTVDDLKKRAEEARRSAANWRRREEQMTTAKTLGPQATTTNAATAGDYDDNRPTNLLGANLNLPVCRPLDRNGKQIVER